MCQDASFEGSALICGAAVSAALRRRTRPHHKKLKLVHYLFDDSADVDQMELAAFVLVGGIDADVPPVGAKAGMRVNAPLAGVDLGQIKAAEVDAPARLRSEERRVGKEGRSGWTPYH